MRNILSQKGKLLSSLLSGILVCSFILTPISSTLAIQRAYAVSSYETNPVVVGGVAKTSVESTMTAIQTSIQTGLMTSLQLKELTFDGIAFALINIVLKEMIRSTTRWVNSGFQGSPAFVTDLGGFLTNIADKVAGNFIYGAGLGFLCSPFKLNVQLALDIQYQKTRGYQAQCRLSQVVSNMENFFNGNFFAGGWDGWYEMALTTGGNPYSAKIEAEAALYASISNAQGQEIKLLDFGKGFMSKKVCNSKPGESAMAQAGAGCKIVTPGSVIEDQLNLSLGSPTRRLEVADEVNELVGALFSQLAQQVLGGIGGLLGLTDSSSGGGDYFDRMSAEREVLGQKDSTNKPLESALQSEVKYYNLQKQMLALITDARAYKDRVYRDDDSCRASGNLTGSLINQATAAQNAMVSSGNIILKLDVLYTDFSLLGDLRTPPATLKALEVKYKASSTPEAENNIMRQFLAFQSAGVLHLETDSTRIELTTLPGLQSEIQAFTASIDTSCRSNGSGGAGGSGRN